MRDKTQSHTGEACLVGEVIGPKKALTLRRRVAVKAGNRYQFEIWARGTNRTKLVLWVVKPGNETREMATAWEGITAKWRNYTVPLSIPADGMLELHIIAPSSHAAPAGKIWIDDIALVETEMPPVASVSGGKGFNDEPSVARTDDGSIFVAWVSFRDGADTLQLARYLPEGKQLAKRGSWQIAGGKDVYVLGTSLVSIGDAAMLLYAAETDKQWNIHAVRCGSIRLLATTAITSDAAVDVKPADAWDARTSTLWLAWESNRNGNRQVFAARLCNERLSDPVAVSPTGQNAYGPSICVLASGEACVAWHGFAENNYDIYLSRKPADGRWSAPRRLTQAPTIDRHAQLFARGDELWLAYENAQVQEYRIGTTNQRRLIMGRVEAAGLKTFRDYRQSPLYGRCEAPSATFDEAGRLWVAYLKPRLPRSGWDTVVTCYDGEKWLTPSPVSTRKGMDRRPGLALGKGRALLAFQVDDLPNSWTDVDRAMEAASDICLASIDLPPAARTSAMRLEPLVEPDETFDAGEIRIQRGEDLPTRSIEYQGRQLKLFGDLHTHTDVSVCNPWATSRSTRRIRTVATSHGTISPAQRITATTSIRTSGRIRPNLSARTTTPAGILLPGRGMDVDLRRDKHGSPLRILRPSEPDPGRPLLPAMVERSQPPDSRRGLGGPAEAEGRLRPYSAPTCRYRHVPTDWKYVDEEAQPVAEIFQIRGSYEYSAPREAGRTTPPGWFLQDAWARGIVIGVIASLTTGAVTARRACSLRN